uniref:AAEL001169 protein n=1 Tax=Fopius arisanus TaxID=64838 RepID=A0A0C9Q500_9HYME
MPRKGRKLLKRKSEGVKKESKGVWIVESDREDENKSVASSNQDSGAEDLLTQEFPNSEDSSDDEVQENDNPEASDEEQDEVLFDSDIESEELSFESDSSASEDQPEESEASETPPKPAKASLPLPKICPTPRKSFNTSKTPEISITSSKLPPEEYEYDSSDEEDIRNTVGNIPMKWYDDYSHIGYNLDGKKLVKPEKGDLLDNFLKRMEDPDFWRSVKDPATGQVVILSEEDINLITRIQKQKIPDPQFDDYAPWVEYFTSEVMKTPLRKFPEHKKSFLPSKNEARQVSKLVHALKMGWIKSSEELKKERADKNKQPQFYMLWQSDDQAEEMRRIHRHIPAPKRHLPGHAESYNPPPEYLFDTKELKQWNKLKMTPWKRKLHFVPQKFNTLREVPAYPKYIKERFQRCLDLYLCPRALKMKLTIEPEELVPQLPSPRDLQPFPTTMSMVYKGHTDMVRSISTQGRGQYFASGGDDMHLRIWEVSTGRCVKVIPCGGIIRCVAWCPNEAVSLIAVAADKKVLLINPGVGDHLVTSKTDKLMGIIPESDVIVSERVKSAVQWEQPNDELWGTGVRIVINHFNIVKQITWHPKGDYFATVMPDGQNRSVLISQLSKRRSQLPFSRPKGLVQCVLFHPVRPIFFVATQRHIRVYDLKKAGDGEEIVVWLPVDIDNGNTPSW